MGCAGYEWLTSTPPHPHNFPNKAPFVTWEAYEYHPAEHLEAAQDRENLPGAGAAVEEEGSNVRTPEGSPQASEGA